MSNTSLIVKMLTSRNEYWCVAKKNYSGKIGSLERAPDSFIFISLPLNVASGAKRDELLDKDIEALKERENLTNIYLTDDYSPFQNGQKYSDYYDGFAITSEPKAFLIKALTLKGDALADYRKLLGGQERVETLENVAKVFAKIMYYGHWKWETPNERVLELLMRELGYYPIQNEDKMIELTAIDESLHGKAAALVAPPKKR